MAAAYFRYPLAAALLGLTAAGLVLLPVLSVAQGFFLSFPSAALPGLWAGAAYTWPWRPSGPDVCLFCLHPASDGAGFIRRRPPPGRTEGPPDGGGLLAPVGCAADSADRAALELTFGPRLLQWVIARTL